MAGHHIAEESADLDDPSDIPTTEWPSVSIILLVKDEGELFKKVFSQITNQRYTGDVEIIVIDSNVSDTSPQWIRENTQEIYQIRPNEFHHGQTREFGAIQANNDVIVYLSTDALPRNRSWLQSLVKPLHTSSADIVYGRQVAYPDAKPMEKFFYSYFYPDSRIRLTTHDYQDRQQFHIENIYISNVSSAIYRPVVKDIGFRDDIPMAEDKDFAYRALEQGYELQYEPSASVYHSHYYTLHSLFTRRFKDGKAYGQLAPSGNGQFVSEGLRYVLQQFRYLILAGKTKWIPYAFVYNLIYFLAFQIGVVIGDFQEDSKETGIVETVKKYKNNI